MMGPTSTLTLIGIVFLVVLAILWFLLPFAIFGTKPKLDELLQETKRANDLLCKISSDIARLAGAPIASGMVKCETCHKSFPDGLGTCPHCGHRRAHA